MEKSIMDETVDILVDRQRLVKDELRKRFRKTKPFRMEAITDAELIKSYDNTPLVELQRYRETYPEEMTILEDRLSDIRRRKFYG